MIICLVYVGLIPTYIRYTIHQIKLWTKLPIYIITDNVDKVKELAYDYDVNYIDSKELFDENIQYLEERKVYFGNLNFLTGRTDLFYKALLRFYLIENMMKKLNIENVFHIETDNLIYYDPLEFKHILNKKGIAYLVDQKGRGCASIFYARDLESLNKLNKTMLSYVDPYNTNEMYFLGRYEEQNKEDVYVLPHIFPVENIYDPMYKNYNDFNGWLFDSASFGLWLTGIDKIHSNNILKKCKNPWIDFDCTGFKHDWKYDNDMKYPVIYQDEKEYKIFNLHVHSKDLVSNLSAPFEYPKNRNLITGEDFQNICDIFIDTSEEDLNLIPSLKDDKRHVHIDSIGEDFDNPKYVYIRGWHMNRMPELLSKFKNPFVLVVHNSDEWIKNNQFLSNLDNPKILAYFSQNLSIDHPKAHLLPIGLANKHWPHGDQNIFKNITKSVKQEGIYFNFSRDTNRYYRDSCSEILLAKGLKWNSTKPYKEYLEELSKHKYAICPMGNGFDCHRTWECVYLGIIPIFINHPFVEKLKPFIKMVILEKWEDLPYENGILDESKLNVYLPSNIYTDMYSEYFIDLIKSY